jgi:hypothetical protein
MHRVLEIAVMVQNDLHLRHEIHLECIAAGEDSDESFDEGAVILGPWRWLQNARAVSSYFRNASIALARTDRVEPLPCFADLTWPRVSLEHARETSLQAGPYDGIHHQRLCCFKQRPVKLATAMLEPMGARFDARQHRGTGTPDDPIVWQCISSTRALQRLNELMFAAHEYDTSPLSEPTVEALCRWLLKHGMRVAAVSKHWFGDRNQESLENFEVDSVPQHDRYEGRILLCGLGRGSCSAYSTSSPDAGTIRFNHAELAAVIVRASWEPRIWMNPPDPDSDDSEFSWSDWEQRREVVNTRIGEWQEVSWRNEPHQQPFCSVVNTCYF